MARLPLPAGGFWEDPCYWAQQAAELAVKAVYQRHGWLFPYIHNLRQLLDGLEDHGLIIPPSVDEAEKLSDYAWITRYPFPGTPATEADYREAVKIAASTVAWAKTFIP